MIKPILLLAGMLALCVAGFLYAEIDASAVILAVETAGWSVAFVVLARFFVVFLIAQAWRVLLPPAHAPGFGLCLRVRIIRDAINSLLPVAQIGGDVAGARLLALGGVAAPMAAASIVSDVFLLIASQFVFTLLGLALLLWFGLQGSVVTNVLLGLALALPLLIGFVLVLRRGAGDFLLAALRKLAGGREWAAIAMTDAFYEAQMAIQRRRGGMLVSFLLHLLAWIVGSLEVYLVFAALGLPIGPLEAIAIESLGQAIRGAAFAVPGAIGVQEGGFVLLCGLFGVAPAPAVAMSLVKRIADLAVGLPGLALWQWAETRHALGALAAASGRRQAEDSALNRDRF